MSENELSKNCDNYLMAMTSKDMQCTFIMHTNQCQWPSMTWLREVSGHPEVFAHVIMHTHAHPCTLSMHTLAHPCTLSMHTNQCTPMHTMIVNADADAQVFACEWYFSGETNLTSDINVGFYMHIIVNAHM